MAVRDWFTADVWRLSARLWTLIVITFTTVFVFLSTPWMSLAAVGALTSFVVYLSWRDGVALTLSPVPGWLVAGGLGGAYILLSVIWSDDPRSSALTAIIVLVLLACVHSISRCLSLCHTSWLAHMTRALLVALICGLLFLLVEELTNHAIKRALFWPFQALRWRDGGISLDLLHITAAIPPARVKWNMPPLNFLLWPALLICALQLGKQTARLPQAIIAAATFWVIVLSDHKSSLPAITLATITFIAAHWNATRTRQVLAVGWVLGFVLIIPLALAGFRAGLHLDERYARMEARIILWNYTAEQIARRPLLGVGAAATRLLDNRNLAEAEAAKPKKFAYARRTGPHAHNIFLQSWFELGAIGTGILLALGLCVLNGVAASPVATQPYLLATLTTVAVTGSASFGLFEVWFMAAFAMCAIASAMAVAYQKRLT